MIPDSFTADFGRPCRHCRQKVISRPRRLCWHCFGQPEVRALYPSTSKFARRGHGNGFRNTPLPQTPTPHLPQTPEKVAVLCQRAEDGEQLFHPEDATYGLS